MRTGTVAIVALAALTLAPVALALTVPIGLPSAPEPSLALPDVAPPDLALVGVAAKAAPATPGAPGVPAANDGPLAVLPDDSILVDPASGALVAPFLPKGFGVPLAAPATIADPGASASPYLGHKRDLPLPTRHLADASPFDVAHEGAVQQAPEPVPQHFARPASRASETDAPTASPLPTPPARAVALTACGAILLLAPLGALYHRFRAGENDRRAGLLQLLAQRPGLTNGDVARELDVDPATARYHLARLAKDQLATEQEGRWFAAGSVPAHERAAVAATHDAGHVLDVVRKRPGSTKADLARALDVGRSTITWHLTTLQEAGLVKIERAGKSVRVSPA